MTNFLVEENYRRLLAEKEEALRSALAERDAAQAELASLRQQAADMREKAEAWDELVDLIEHSWARVEGSSGFVVIYELTPCQRDEKESKGVTLLEAVRAARKEQG